MDNYPETGYTPENLRYLRAQHKLTQTDVGNLTNSTLRAVQKWEANPNSKEHSGMPHRKWLKLLESLKK